MRIEVVLVPSLLPESQPEGLYVLVDVLRTSTTLCTALAHGADAVLPCVTPEEAWELAQREPEGTVLLAGEQDGRPIPGFALENSPLEYTEEAVAGKRIAFVSTNGTPLLRRLPDGEGAGTVVMGLVNRAAVVEYCHQLKPEAVFICCAGHKGSVAYEDVIGAGALVAELRQLRSVALTDAAHVAFTAFQHAEPDLLSAVLRCSRHARFLTLEGKQRDVEYALQLDCLSVVPRWHAGRLCAVGSRLAQGNREVQQPTIPECAA
ncbi:MAG: 2-phosphosulfolactate phosphatase [Chlorobiota bacterium]